MSSLQLAGGEEEVLGTLNQTTQWQGFQSSRPQNVPNSVPRTLCMSSIVKLTPELSKPQRQISSVNLSGVCSFLCPCEVPPSGSSRAAGDG